MNSYFFSAIALYTDWRDRAYVHHFIYAAQLHVLRPLHRSAYRMGMLALFDIDSIAMLFLSEKEVLLRMRAQLVQMLSEGAGY